MSIVVEPNADWKIVHDLEREAGWERTPREVQRSFEIFPRGQFLARDGDEVVGCASAISYEGGLAWIGGMFVREPFRGRGVGRALLDATLAHARVEGATTIGLDATAQAVPLYAKAGFVARSTSGRWRRDGPARLAPVVGGPVAIYPISVSELMEVVQFDRARFGASRGPLIAAFLRDFPQHAFLAYARGSGALKGYVLARERWTGPLVADDAATARALLAAAEASGALPALFLTGQNVEAERLASEAGYRPDGEFTRMSLGPWPTRDAAIFYG